VRYPHQVDERASLRNALAIARGIERIANRNYAALRRPALRLLANQHSN